MQPLDWSWYLATAIGLAIACLPLLFPKLGEKIGWLFAISAAVFLAIGIHDRLRYRIVVTLSPETKKELGFSYPFHESGNANVYQGEYENAFVIWIDGRFFQLGSDGQQWITMVEPIPTSDPKWFTRKFLKAKFPQCGQRIPLAGVAKALLGSQKYYWGWIGCPQTENSQSTVSDVKLQQFENGWVLEGIAIPPQSQYRNRVILISGTNHWIKEVIDEHAHPTAIRTY
jgi:hypothetical protein